jgi:phosphate transport system substrate-binding protein
MFKKLAAILVAALLAPGAVFAAGVTIKGSDTMVILAQRWAEEYMKKNPGTKVQVTGGGSGVGIAALINGTTDIATASRRMKEDEQEKLRARSSTPGVEISVAKDGVAFYINAANPVSALTVEQLKSIYQGDITNWKEVGGPDARIVLYSRENSSGTYVFVKDNVLKGEDYAPQAQTLPGTAAVVNAVAKEKNGIGYGGAAYAKGVKELKIKAGKEEIGPDAEHVKKGTYPLARDLYFYLRAKPAGEVKTFIDFCLSPQGQQIVNTVGYYPIQ